MFCSNHKKSLLLFHEHENILNKKNTNQLLAQLGLPDKGRSNQIVVCLVGVIRATFRCVVTTCLFRILKTSVSTYLSSTPETMEKHLDECANMICHGQHTYVYAQVER